jgi:small subunit ribosomal protein S20
LNAPLRTRARTSVKKARKLLAGNDGEAAEQAVRDAVVALDKAAQKGALHRNNASRRKSRIVKHLLRSRRD